MTKSQVDKLGERLKSGNYSDHDLRLLDEYRQSFGAVGQQVIGALREKLLLQPTGRPAKTTNSIIAKLLRQSISLSRVQDIGGCRVIVDDISAQDTLVDKLPEFFVKYKVVDRREKPSHGYRAVHVVVTLDRKIFEIQIRTRLQHLWAEYSERLSDTIDPNIKYGGGPVINRTLLADAATAVSQIEFLEQSLAAGIEARYTDSQKRYIMDARQQLKKLRQVLMRTLQNMVTKDG